MLHLNGLSAMLADGLEDTAMKQQSQPAKSVEDSSDGKFTYGHVYSQEDDDKSSF